MAVKGIEDDWRLFVSDHRIVCTIFLFLDEENLKKMRRAYRVCRFIETEF